MGVTQERHDPTAASANFINWVGEPFGTYRYFLSGFTEVVSGMQRAGDGISLHIYDSQYTR
jgi:hypothetical protein